MKKYELIFLDADDTLFDYKAAEKNALTTAFAVHGITISEQTIADYAKINKQLWLDYEKNLITKDKLRTERFRLLFEKLDYDLDEKEFSSSYLKCLAESSQLFKDSEEVCKYLHSKYTTAIITNGIGVVQRSRLEKSSIKKYIDYLIISEDANCSKPNVGIFNYAETITGFHDKDKMLIVGDSFSSDILGGINYGIDTCWINTENKENPTEIKPSYTVDSLRSITEFL